MDGFGLSSISGTRSIIRELCQEIGLNVVLFTADGTTFFGLLQRIEDGRFARLTPAGGQRHVIVIPPNGVVYLEDFTLIDLCTLVAKSVNANTFPFEDLEIAGGGSI
ncbi:hypothetical protein [Sporomusa acidovorans]|uniref:Uncharacterized protein n=1 Tax=Sporomusa acidovorans (strain ATCC 49682 / DSM 3132 / Mol) TaxID=1123286 RepID=A0ABZ3JB80_SPOA4|nr:hypothetical protein [Sporomusa acidovorans]OZC13270.1 hypothetical protein SPACI_57650 [Sporomusa acidovorans DSM 3132]SDD98607.1 hypothetical protein SAMN04488499_100685 [Sporomusa acidovorans]